MAGKYEPMSNLKILRIKKGYTQIALSEKIGKAKNLVYLYESGHSFPTKKMLEKLAKALECEIKDIV